jgi:hypothetical protein
MSLDDLLRGASLLDQQIPIVRVTTLALCNFSIEKNEETGGFSLIFDLLLSPQAAERYTLPFDAQGFEKFRSAILAAGTGIELAAVPPSAAGPLQ